MNSRVARFALALLVLAAAIPAVARVTEDDIARARRDLDRVMADADELGARVQAAWARQLELEHEISKLEQAIAHANVQLADAEERLVEVSVEMYMSAASGTGVGMMMNVDQSTYQAGLEYLKTVNGSGRELINELTVLGAELERLNARKTEASAEQLEVTAELEMMSADLLAQVASAQVQYDNLVERGAAKR